MLGGYNGVVDQPDDARPALPAERSSFDAIIELYKKDVDRTLLRQALLLSPAERLHRLVELTRFTEAIRDAGKKTFR